ncbi:hypothetical protein IAU60_000052 [Kwoniella sp. DSM 27419]
MARKSRLSEADIHHFHLSHPPSSQASIPPSSSAEPSVADVDSALNPSLSLVASALSALPPDLVISPPAGSSSGALSEIKDNAKPPATRKRRAPKSVLMDATEALPHGDSAKKRKQKRMSLNGGALEVGTSRGLSEEQIILYHLTHPARPAVTADVSLGASASDSRVRKGKGRQAKEEDRPRFSRPLPVLSSTSASRRTSVKAKRKRLDEDEDGGQAASETLVGRPRRVELSNTERLEIPREARSLAKNNGCSAAFWLGGLEDWEGSTSASLAVIRSGPGEGLLRTKPPGPIGGSASSTVTPKKTQKKKTPKRSVKHDRVAGLMADAAVDTSGSPGANAGLAGDVFTPPPKEKKPRVSTGKRRPKWVTETPK